MKWKISLWEWKILERKKNKAEKKLPFKFFEEKIFPPGSSADLSKSALTKSGSLWYSAVHSFKFA